jgi:hypothetical protein
VGALVASTRDTREQATISGATPAHLEAVGRPKGWEWGWAEAVLGEGRGVPEDMEAPAAPAAPQCSGAGAAGLVGRQEFEGGLEVMEDPVVQVVQVDHPVMDMSCLPLRILEEGRGRTISNPPNLHDGILRAGLSLQTTEAGQASILQGSSLQAVGEAWLGAGLRDRPRLIRLRTMRMRTCTMPRPPLPRAM